MIGDQDWGQTLRVCPLNCVSDQFDVVETDELDSAQRGLNECAAHAALLRPHVDRTPSRSISSGKSRHGSARRTLLACTCSLTTSISAAALSMQGTCMGAHHSSQAGRSYRSTQWNPVPSASCSPSCNRRVARAFARKFDAPPVKGIGVGYSMSFVRIFNDL